MNEKMCLCGCGRRPKNFKPGTGEPCEYVSGHYGKSLAHYLLVQVHVGRKMGMDPSEYLEHFHGMVDETKRAPIYRVAERHGIPLSTFSTRRRKWLKWVDRHGERFWEQPTNPEQDA